MEGVLADRKALVAALKDDDLAKADFEAAANSAALFNESLTDDVAPVNKIRCGG